MNFDDLTYNQKVLLTKVYPIWMAKNHSDWMVQHCPEWFNPLVDKYCPDWISKEHPALISKWMLTYCPEIESPTKDDKLPNDIEDFLKEEPQDDMRELMYVVCCACREFLDVKPGPMGQITHGYCPDCYSDAIKQLPNNS